VTESYKKYILYLRSSSEEVRFLHAIVVSSIATGFFIAIYLFIVRGADPTVYLLEDKTYISK
jgi:inner membrane protein involved in colicin E2 resistance